MNYLTELIRLRDDEGTSGWAKETAKSILALKDRSTTKIPTTRIFFSIIKPHLNRQN